MKILGAGQVRAAIRGLGSRITGHLAGHTVRHVRIKNSGLWALEKRAQGLLEDIEDHGHNLSLNTLDTQAARDYQTCLSFFQERVQDPSIHRADLPFVGPFNAEHPELVTKFVILKLFLDTLKMECSTVLTDGPTQSTSDLFLDAEMAKKFAATAAGRRLAGITETSVAV